MNQNITGNVISQTQRGTEQVNHYKSHNTARKTNHVTISFLDNLILQLDYYGSDISRKFKITYFPSLLLQLPKITCDNDLLRPYSFHVQVKVWSEKYFWKSLEKGSSNYFKGEFTGGNYCFQILQSFLCKKSYLHSKN